MGKNKFFCPADLCVGSRGLIDKLQQINLIPKVFICDQAGCNQGLFRSLGLSHKKSSKTYIVRKNCKIHFMWDYPHLLKSVRNMILKYKLKLNKAKVDFKYVKEVYELEKYQIARSTKLTSIHINPNGMVKMRVEYAAQTLSSSVAGAVSTYATLRYTMDQDLERFYEASATAKFVEDIKGLLKVY